MKFYLTLAVLCFTVVTAFAQRNPELIHSGEVIEKGIEAHDEGEYQKALNHYDKVHPSDTNYLLSIYEKSLTYNAMEEYQKAIEQCEKALSLDYHNPEVYNTLGTALDELDKHEEALNAYDRGLTKFPYSMSLLFNKAVVFESMEDREKALNAYRELVKLNQFHASSHIRLAVMAALEDEVTQSLMSLLTYLVLEPGSGRSFNLLSYGDAIASLGSEDINSDDQDVIGSEFKDLELIVKNRIALNEKYETPSDLGFPIIKQAHLIMTQLSKNEAQSDGFWGQHYGPILKWVIDEDYFEEFAILISMSVDQEAVQKLVDKNIDDIREFRNNFLTEWRAIHGEYTITHEGEQLETQKWFHNDFALQAFGLENNQGQNDGLWKYYYPTGQIETIGTFQNGDRVGEWISFTTRGDTAQVHNFKSGKLDGPYKIFGKKGMLSEKGNYVNGEMDGKVKTYFDTGQLELVLRFENGKRNGLATYYYKTGETEQELTLKDNQLHGDFIEYYPNGQIRSKVKFAEGERQGVSESFFYDGTLKQKVTFEDNLLEGPYITYYQNGQVKSQGDATKDAVSGEWTYYHPDGSLEKTSDFSENGKINGESISYDFEERPFQIEEFRKGELRSVSFIDEEGKEFHSAKARRGKIESVFYDYRRKKASEGTYVDGERSGEWKYYDIALNVDKIENYKNGDLHGDLISYFKDGTISYKREFEDDEAVGFYRSNYRSDSIYAEGNYYKGNQECTWYYYYPNGQLEKEQWFEKGKVKGESVEYSVSGVPDLKTIYSEPGLFSGYVSFDTSGAVVDSVFLKNGTGNFVLKGASGNDQFSGEYLGGMANGEFKWFYPDGSPEVEGQYEHDKRTGTWTYYHPNGEISSKGEYVEGNKHGTWLDHNYFGELISEKEYFHGKAHGIFTYYYPSGEKRTVTDYEFDIRNGSMSFYAPDGALIVERIYDHNHMVAFTYLDENGDRKEPIAIENETVDLVAYYPNGNKSAEYKVDGSWFEGPYTLYYQDGSKLKETTYLKDEQNGEDIYYYPDGTVMSEDYSDFGELHGAQKVYYPNGQLKSIINYRLGEKHGKSEYFDETGKMLQSVLFYANDPYEM